MSNFLPKVYAKLSGQLIVTKVMNRPDSGCAVCLRRSNLGHPRKPSNTIYIHLHTILMMPSGCLPVQVGSRSCFPDRWQQHGAEVCRRARHIGRRIPAQGRWLLPSTLVHLSSTYVPPHWLQGWARAFPPAAAVSRRLRVTSRGSSHCSSCAISFTGASSSAALTFAACCF